MPKKWTGEIVKLLHNNELSQNELAAEIGWTIEYVSLILNGKRDPKNAQEKMQKALNALIERKKRDER